MQASVRRAPPQFLPTQYGLALVESQKNLLFIGIAGSDWAVRGRVLAFDVSSGREMWRWYSIPTEARKVRIPGHHARRRPKGSGAFWTSYMLDSATGELFIPLANPAPDYNSQPGVREGVNLYTDSVVVLDAPTGRMKWYHQFAQNDPWDYDIGAAPVLFATPEGKRRITQRANCIGYATALTPKVVAKRTCVS
jgi:alcohol dehydrogenase (cytochrome c)